MSEPRPLDPVRSIKAKLGLLVGVSVLVAVVLGTVGSAAGVPWWLSIPVAVALSLGVTQLLAAGMVAPLREMTAAAGRMARGDYATPVLTQSRDEVGELAAAFNRMADDLGRVDQERRELIATVSHELRTPVAALTAELENLADGVVAADTERLVAVHARAERLGALVGDLLALSRLEAGVTRLDRRPTDLRLLVAEAAEEVTASGRVVRWQIEVPDRTEVDADAGRLRQLLVNVLDNAARHSPAGGPVRVRGGREPSGWWLDVADDGPGLPVADRDRAFDRFGTDGAGGTGLGLAIARWVAELHGGTLRFADPEPGRAGARLRLSVPHQSPPQEEAVTDPDAAPTRGPAEVPAVHPDADPAVGRAADRAADRAGDRAGDRAAARGAERLGDSLPTGAALDGTLRGFWPEPPGLSGLRVVGASAAVGVLAGALMAFAWPGIVWTVVLLLAGATAYATSRHRRDPFTLVCTGLAALLVLPLTLRDDLGISVLCVLAAAAVFLVGITRARTLPGFVLAGLSWPLAGLRGLPWLGRSVGLTGSAGRNPAVVRTLAWSLLALLVFGALFTSADALFASWVDTVVPNLTLGSLVVRAFVAVAVFGLTLAAAYVALNPPQVEIGAGASPAPLRNRFEWLVPVLLVDAVFVAFLAAQATAVFGGHGYVESTTGLTYADYVHQGFGQLTVATALTLLVVGLAARWAGRSPEDVRWLRISLGLLCALALVVVASALHRMHLYQEAYGFTVLRLVVDVVEGWLGFLVLAVMVAGLAGWSRWLPRAALVSGAVALLGMVALNPDAWVADRNLDRYAATGRLDLSYLQSLSADATPVLARRLPPDLAGCALRVLARNQLADSVTSDWRTWNLARHRALPHLERLDVSRAPSTSSTRCPDSLGPR